MEQFHHLQDLNIYSSCRTCLENLNGMEMHYDIFAIPDLQQKLAVCSSLPVEPGDGLPTSLCESCHTKIDDFYIFQQMCISARARFQDYINSDRKPSSMDFAIHPNNQTDFMIFTITKKENEEEDPITHHLYSEYIETETSFKVEHQLEASSHGEADQPYGKYNVDLTENSRNDRSREKETEGTGDDMICVKKTTNASLNTINLQCEICKKCFKKIETFEVHMRLHQGLKPFPCQLCDKSYSRHGRLKSHIKVKHEGRPEENFPCTELGCDRILPSKITLQQHTRDVHWKNAKKPNPPYNDDECEKVQTRLNAPKNHRHLHTRQQQPHECLQCHKTFTSKTILRDHLNRHDGIKNYTCPHCGTKKTTRRELQKHINVHTKEEKYPCKLCDMVYYNVYNLNRHKRLFHEGIKDYPCSYCEKSFGRSETRKHHEMTHTGERPHECNICYKKFIQTVSLKKHEKVHLKAQRKKK